MGEFHPISCQTTLNVVCTESNIHVMITCDTEVFIDHVLDLPSSTLQEYLLLEVRVVEVLLQGNRNFGIWLLEVEVPFPVFDRDVCMLSVDSASSISRFQAIASEGRRNLSTCLF